MADTPWAAYPTASLPSLDQFITPPAPTPVAQPAATGTGNWFTAGLGSGAYGALGQIGSAGEAVAKLAGSDDFAKKAADFAARQKATAATYARPDLEANPWSLSGMGYQLAQGLPAMAGFIGAGALAAATAPEDAAVIGAGAAGAGLRSMLGAGAAALPLSVGQNVQESEAANGPISQKDAAKAIALGLPEAALQSFVPAKLESFLAHGATGGLLSEAAKAAGINAGVAGATQALTSLMGDPNRTFADRAQNVLDAALSGGLQGAVFGGAIHALSKRAPAAVTTDDLKGAIDSVIPPEPQMTGSTQLTVRNPNSEVAIPGAPQSTALVDPNAGPSPMTGGRQVVPASSVAVEPYEAQNTALTDPRSTPPAPPSNALPGPSPDAAQLPPPDVRPLAAKADEDLLKAQRWYEQNPPEDEQNTRLQNMINFEIKTRQEEAARATPKLTASDAIQMPGEVETPAQPVPDVIKAGPPSDIPSKPFSQLDDPSLIHANANDLQNTDIQQEMGTRVSPETRAAGIQKDILAVAKSQGSNQVPQFLKGKTFTSEVEIASEVAKEIQRRDEAGKDVSKTLQALGEKYNVFGDQGDVRPELLGPRDDVVGALGDEPAPPASTAPSIDAIPDKNKPQYTELERLRAAIAHENIPDSFNLMGKVDELQSRLQAPKAGDVQRIVKETKALQAEVAGAKAGAERKALDQQAPVPAKTPVAEGTPPSPKAVKAVADIQAKQTAAQAKGIKMSEDALAKAGLKTPPKNQAEAKAAKTAPAPAPTPAPKVEVPDVKSISPALRGPIDRAKSALVELYKQAKVRGGDKNVKDAQALTDQLNKQSSKLAQVIKAAATKGGLASIRADHFGTELWDEHGDKVDAKTEQLMEKHADAEQDLIEAVQRARGETPRVAPASGVKTQGDVDLAHLISNGASGADALRYIQENGSSGEAKEIAGRLLQAGIDPKVRFADIDNFKFDNDRAEDPNATVKGSYNPALDRVNVYDSSDIEKTLLHEAAHAATQKAIDNGSPAGKELQGLFDRLKARSPNNDAYGLTNANEMVAEAFSNPTFRDFLKGERASTGSKLLDMWQGFKNAVFKALGLTDRVRTAFDQLMDTAHRAMAENTGKGFDSETPSVTNEKIKAAAARASEDDKTLLEGAKAEIAGHAMNWSSGFRKTMLGWVTGDHLAQVYGEGVKGIKALRDHLVHKTAVTDALSKPSKAASVLAHSLSKKEQGTLNKIMQHTILNMDLTKSWAENKWLHAPEKATEAQRAQATRLQSQHADGVKMLNELKKNPEAFKAFEKLRDANRANAFSKLVYHVHDLVTRDYAEFGLKGFDKNPFTEFNAQSELHDDPTKAMKYWQDTLTSMRGELDKFSSTLKSKLDNTATPLDEATRDATRKLRSPASSMVAQVDRMLKQMSEGTYFHLGREGSHFASGQIALDKNGQPSTQSLAAMEAALKSVGLHDVGLQHNAENNNVYVRLNSPAEMDQARKAFEALEDKGHLVSGSVAAGRAENLNIYGKIGPAWMKRAMEAVKGAKPDTPDWLDDKAKAAFEAAHAQKMRDMSRALMDLMPDNTLSKVYQRRDGVQGFNADMLHSFDKASIANSRGIGGMATARDIARAANEIKAQVHEINRDRKYSSSQREAFSQAAAEAIQREASSMMVTASPGMDAVKRTSHAVTLGMSPAYFAMLMSQIPTLSLPKLGSTHGFLKSAQALAKATPMTFKIVKAMVQSKEWTNFALRDEYLQKAGIPDDVRKFIMTQAGRGDFNLGTFTNEMVGHDPQGLGHVQHFMHNLSTLSLYSEMIPRVLTALAAKGLHRPGIDGDLHEFTSEKVNGSQLDWNHALAPRQLTKGGSFGAASPLINQFMGFQVRMTELLYRETHSALAGATPEARAASRKFLLAHLAATTVFAGALGLPFVGVAASVYDRLADWATGTDDHDILASFRTHLANTFGKDIGEVIARGAPRAGGFDFARAGEGTILPGSSTIMMLTEKRKIEDAEKDWLKSMAGSAVGVGMNYATAIRDFSNGDYMNAGIKLAPEGLKNVLEAVQLGHRGFVNKDGQKLPITASAQDVALKAFGLEGAKEQEYNEVRRTQLGLQALSQARSTNITHHLLQAYNRQDQGDFQKWTGESTKYGLDHPGELPPIADFGKTLMSSMKEQSLAQVLGTPIGVKPNDLVGRGMTSFGNFRN